MFSLLKRRCDRKPVYQTEVLRAVDGIIDVAQEILVLVFETCAQTPTKLILIEAVSGTQGDHIIPDIFGADVIGFRSVGMRAKIEIDIKLLVFHLSLEHIGCKSYTKGKREREWASNERGIHRFSRRIAIIENQHRKGIPGER